MIVLVDGQQSSSRGFVESFAREGIPLAALSSDDFEDWMTGAPESDFMTVEAFLLGDCRDRVKLSQKIRKRSTMPVLAVSEKHSLQQTLELFHAGMDDVLHRPVHVQEILARVAAIYRRMERIKDTSKTGVEVGPIRVFNDGRDPEISGSKFILPRRERRILEYLVSNRDKRVNKGQIFNAVYGIFNDEVEESVIESHISKLRKKLKSLLGYDVIDSKRFLGYQLVIQNSV